MGSIIFNPEKNGNARLFITPIMYPGFFWECDGGREGKAHRVI